MREREILMRWALRFDGHTYREDTKFDTAKFAERFFFDLDADLGRSA